jgi:hypothetical protein
MSRTDLISRWEARRADLAKLHALVDGASLVAEFLLDLEQLGDSEPAVSLTEAAARKGYTADHFSRLIKLGKLRNWGRKHAPRVRVSECPTKPKPNGRLAGGYAKAYDVITDARSLVSTRR